jgi:hypothetical protein
VEFTAENQLGQGLNKAENAALLQNPSKEGGNRVPKGNCVPKNCASFESWRGC